MEVPLKPLGKEDVRKLELGLIFGTLFRPDVIERIKNAEDRLTWLDSLVVAAAALARQRAGYSVPQIAEEVGRTDSTVRNHLEGKTEAGKLVKETYELLVKSGGRLELKLPEELGGYKEAPPDLKEAVQKVKASLEGLEKAFSELKEAVDELATKA